MIQRSLRQRRHRHLKRKDKQGRSNRSEMLAQMGPMGGKRLVQQEQMVLKAAQRRWPRLAELVQMVSMLVMARSALRALLTESLMEVTLSKVPQASMLQRLPRPLVRSAQRSQQPMQQLQPAPRHRQCS